MFNIRVKTFCDSQQIQVFSRAQRSKGEVIRKKFDYETGEILPNPRGKLKLNPFTGEMERMTEYHEHDAEMYARMSCNRTINAIYDIARSDSWEWFFTLTFNPNKVNRYDYVMCSKKLHYWLSNMRKVCPDMRYVVVPEQHKDGAWHFHGLFKDIDNLEMHFSGRRDNKGRRIYNCLSYTWGFTTATRITDFRRASSYLCKYITKELCASTKGKKRYWASRNVKRPTVDEYMIEEDYTERLISALNCGDAHVKTIKTPYTNVTYIENIEFDLGSVYSQNMCLWNRYISRSESTISCYYFLS